MLTQYFTSEERKTEAVYIGDYYEFHFVYDLSTPITVNKLFYVKTNNLNSYTKDVCGFMHNHMKNILPHLNGFSGYDTIRFKFNDDIKF
jgi:hypothetical protein